MFTNSKIVVTIITGFFNSYTLNSYKNCLLIYEFTCFKVSSTENDIGIVKRSNGHRCFINNFNSCIEKFMCTAIVTSFTTYADLHTNFKCCKNVSINLVCIVTTIFVLEVYGVVLVTVRFAINTIYNTFNSKEVAFFSIYILFICINSHCRNFKIEYYSDSRTIGSSNKSSKTVCDIGFTDFRSFGNVNSNSVFTCQLVAFFSGNIVLNLNSYVVRCPFNCVCAILKRKNLCQVVVANCIGNRIFFSGSEFWIKLNECAFSIIQVVNGIILAPFTSCKYAN